MKNDAYNIRECYAAGYAAGVSAASWTDLPELGTEIDKHIDWVGYAIVDRDNQLNVWEMLAYAGESNSRSYSPWEFTAHAINSRDTEYGEWEANAGWDAYERGIAAGIAANRRKRFPLNNRRKW